jgi:hypothetical protein
MKKARIDRFSDFVTNRPYQKIKELDEKFYKFYEPKEAFGQDLYSRFDLNPEAMLADTFLINKQRAMIAWLLTILQKAVNYKKPT